MRPRYLRKGNGETSVCPRPCDCLGRHSRRDSAERYRPVASVAGFGVSLPNTNASNIVHQTGNSRQL